VAFLHCYQAGINNWGRGLRKEDKFAVWMMILKNNAFVEQMVSSGTGAKSSYLLDFLPRIL
jgi:hypothetical protein